MSFFDWYFGLSGDTTEQSVLCPFPHGQEGRTYYETKASAQVNIDKKLFHCMGCGKGGHEAWFIQQITGATVYTARRLISQFINNDGLTQWLAVHPTVPNAVADSYNISSEVQQELRIASHANSEVRNILFPVFMYNKLVDIRTYTPDSVPKCKSTVGAVAGLIVPFDLWVNTPKERMTIICAGEKDMAVARSKGFNAITLTGGEGIQPITPRYFKDRSVAICYDNDDTGRIAAKKLGLSLLKAGAFVKVVTAFHEGMENKEDITDYFNKYGKTKQDLIDCIEATEIYAPEFFKDIPTVTMFEASQGSNVGKILKANIQVSAIADDVYTTYKELIATKWAVSEDSKANNMAVNTSLDWVLSEDNMQDILHLVDNNFKEKNIRENRLKLLGVPFGERNVRVEAYEQVSVYKATVTDMFETVSVMDTMPMEYHAYAIGHRLESGKKYTVTFKLVPHPYSGQQLTMIIWDVKEAADSIKSFKVNEGHIAHLKRFQRKPDEDLAAVIENYINRAKGLIGYDGNNSLIKTIDLAFHTPLQFHLGRYKNLRAYIDTIIVGESRMGKSSTTEAMRKEYGLGTFISLAGNAATTAGLIGGSNKVGSSYQTKAGLIPQNNGGMIIFEEFGKCSKDILTELTDIRSSNVVNITRVSGSLLLPALTRMITLSNLKTQSNAKEIRSIASYPNGIAVVAELVGSAEDIARYDVLLVLGDRGASFNDPYWEPSEPFTQEEYRTRIRWIWSRTPEQINISQEIGTYIFQKANELNATYDTHIKIFGTEAWKKLARIAIAVAGYTVSTQDFETIDVLKEHVDYAVQYMIDIYDNNTFKLREYVEHERKYSMTDDDATRVLNEIYQTSPGIIHYLEREPRSNRQTLSAASGLNNDQLTSILNRLVQGMFIKLQGSDIVPTERFRITLPNMNRAVPRRIGDISGNS